MNDLQNLLKSIETKLEQILIVLIDNNKVNSTMNSQIKMFFENLEIQNTLNEIDDDCPWNESESEPEDDENPPY